MTQKWKNCIETTIKSKLYCMVGKSEIVKKRELSTGSKVEETDLSPRNQK